MSKPIPTTLDAVKAEIAELDREMKSTQARLDRGEQIDEGEEIRIERLVRRYDRLNAAREVLEANRETKIERVREAAKDPNNVHTGSGPDALAEERRPRTMETLDRDPLRDSRDVRRVKHSDPWAEASPDMFASPNVAVSELRSRAFAAIENMSGASDSVRESATKFVERFDDNEGSISRHILTLSDPAYMSGWSKVMRGKNYLLQAEEVKALERADILQRAMSEGTGSAGGFLVPTQLDPTIVIDASGSENPIRELARKVIATGKTWTGVTSGSVTASWDAEAAEVSDDTPTLAQPSIDIHMARVFIPYSIEVGMDSAGNFTEELVKLMVDAKEELEATAFTTGTGTGQPQGLIVGLQGTAFEFASNTTDTFALSDVYDLFEDLNPRYRNRGDVAWMSNVRIAQAIREAGGNNLDDFWAPIGSAIPAQLLGEPYYLNSNMDGVIDAGADNRVLVLGSMSHYVIADRLGFTVESVPHLVATANNLPSGQRGLFGYVRTGAEVTVPRAFALLNVT